MLSCCDDFLLVLSGRNFEVVLIISDNFCCCLLTLHVYYRYIHTVDICDRLNIELVCICMLFLDMDEKPLAGEMKEEQHHYASSLLS